MRVKAVGFLLLALCLPQIAVADPKDDARRHFSAGLSAAQANNYVDALKHFLAAQKAYPHPNTLFNIGRAYQDKGDLEQAIAYYELFQRAAPEKAKDVDPIVAVLRARLQPGPESTPNTSTSSQVASTDLSRLQDIASELQSLVERLETRPAETTPTEQTDTLTDQPSGSTTPIEGANEGGFRAEAYERIVVTASRYGQTPLDSPSTITVISENDIRLTGATNVPDLLRRVAGIDMMSMTSSQPDLSIRGFNRELSNKVLVLIDGRSVYWDFIGTTFWSTLPISMEDIERIEVIRGPGSAVYGANAMTGVVNIITKAPGENPGTSLSLSSGYPDYLHGVVSTSGTVGDTSYRLGGQFTTQGRWGRVEKIVDNSALILNLPDQDRAQSTASFYGRMDRRFGRLGFASASGGYSTGYAEFYNIGALGNSLARNQHHFLRTDIGYGPLLFRAFWNQDRGSTQPVVSTVGTSRDVSSDFRGDTFDVELSGNGEFETGPIQHRLSGGIGYRRKSVAKFKLLSGDKVENHVNVYLNEEASFGPITTVFSLRLDRHPLIPLGKTISPRGAFIFRLADKTALRLTGGTAFRAPNMVESYMDFALSTSSDGVYIQDYGSQNLVPERIVTAELGFHDESSLYHMADVVLYYNRVTDFIGLAPVTPAAAPFSEIENGYLAGTTGWINLDPVYTGVGVEAEVEVYPVDGLDIFANLNFATILEESDGVTIRDGSTSLAKANLGATYSSPYRTDFGLTMHYVSSQEWRIRDFDAAGNIAITQSKIPARFLISARIASRPLANEGLELAVTLFNGLGLSPDLRFREHPAGQLVGPRLFGTVSYRF